MEHRTSDAFGAGTAAWFLAALQGDDGPAEPDGGAPPDVIITVSLDELDGMTGDMLV